jgi:hypothetical protein
MGVRKESNALLKLFAMVISSKKPIVWLIPFSSLQNF